MIKYFLCLYYTENAVSIILYFNISKVQCLQLKTDCLCLLIIYSSICKVNLKDYGLFNLLTVLVSIKKFEMDKIISNIKSFSKQRVLSLKKILIPSTIIIMSNMRCEIIKIKQKIMAVTSFLSIFFYAYRGRKFLVCP